MTDRLTKAVEKCEDGLNGSLAGESYSIAIEVITPILKELCEEIDRLKKFPVGEETDHA